MLDWCHRGKGTKKEVAEAGDDEESPYLRVLVRLPGAAAVRLVVVLALPNREAQAVLINSELHSDRCPSVVLCLGVESERVDYGEQDLDRLCAGSQPDTPEEVSPLHAPRVWHERLVRWELRQYRWRCGKLTGERTLHGDSGTPLWEQLCAYLPQRKGALLVSVSLARDLTLTDLWGALLHGGWQCCCLIADGRTCAAVLTSPRWTHVECVDPANYFLDAIRPQTLGDRGQLAVPPLTDAIRRDDCSADGRAESARAAAEALLSAVRELNLGPLRLTGAAQAHASWCRGRCPVPVEAHYQREVVALEREAYYGGRCEVFQPGLHVDPTYVLDCTWSYPSIMMEADLPVRLLDYGRSHTDPNNWCGVTGRIYVARVLVAAQTPVPVRAGATHDPAVPGHARRPNDPRDTHATRPVRYLTGRHTTVLCGAELRRAAQAGEIIEVYEWAEYEARPALRQWGHWLWQQYQRARAAGLDSRASMLKGFGRALYGRFARRVPQWEQCTVRVQPRDYGEWLGRSSVTGDTTLYRALGRSVARLTRTDYPDDSLVLLSACIASEARVRLQRWIDCAGIKHVRYCDTDSLHVDKEGRMNLLIAGAIHDNAPGKLKLEKLAQESEYIRRRHYRLDSEWTISGIPLSRQEQADGTVTADTTRSVAVTLDRGPDGQVKHERREYRQ